LSPSVRHIVEQPPCSTSTDLRPAAVVEAERLALGDVDAGERLCGGLCRPGALEVHVVGGADEDGEEVEQPIADDHGDGDEDLVAIEPMEATPRQLGVVPEPALALDVGPHEPPRHDGAEQQREVDDVRADHADSDVGRREVEEEAAAVGIHAEGREGAEPAAWPRRVEPLEERPEEASGEGLEEDGHLLLRLDGALRRVEAVDEVRGGGAARVGELVADDHDLAERDDGEEADEADEEEEGDDPAEGRLLDVDAGLGLVEAFGDLLAHAEDVGAEAAGEGDAGAGDDAGLHHRVLLPGERFREHAAPLQRRGPRLHEEEGQEPRRHVERRHDPGGQVELHHDEAQEQAQTRAHHHGTHRDLLRPRR